MNYVTICLLLLSGIFIGQKTHNYFFEKLKMINNNLTKEDVWKVFMKDGKTLSTKEDIRRVSRAYSCIKLPPPPSPPASPQPQRRQRRKPVVEKVETVVGNLNFESVVTDSVNPPTENNMFLKSDTNLLP